MKNEKFSRVTKYLPSSLSGLVSIASLIALLVVSGCMVTESSKPAINQEKAVEDRIAAGLEYLQYGKPGEARRHLSRALEINSKSAPAHNAMALLYKYEGDPENEERHLKKALWYESGYSPARNNYGTYLYLERRYKDALKHFKRAAEDPAYDGRGVAIENMARCYQALGEKEQAKKAYLKSTRLNARSVTAYLELGWIYFSEDRPKLAYEYYQQYIQRVQNQSPRGLLLGVRLEDVMGNEDARASYEMALKQMYPKSREFRVLQEWLKGEAND